MTISYCTYLIYSRVFTNILSNNEFKTYISPCMKLIGSRHDKFYPQIRLNLYLTKVTVPKPYLLKNKTKIVNKTQQQG